MPQKIEFFSQSFFYFFSWFASNRRKKVSPLPNVRLMRFYEWNVRWFCKAWSFWETESLSITWGVMLNFSMFSSFVFMDRSILSRIWESCFYRCKVNFWRKSQRKDFWQAEERTRAHIGSEVFGQAVSKAFKWEQRANRIKSSEKSQNQSEIRWKPEKSSAPTF